MLYVDSLAKIIRSIDGIHNHLSSQDLADKILQPILAAISEGCEPVYQLHDTYCWREVDLLSYSRSAESKRRILWTAPPVVASEPVAFAELMPGSAGFTMACFRAEDIPAVKKSEGEPQ